MVKVKRKKVEEKLDTRTPDGRWTKGHKGGPGNPNFNKIALYRKAINDAVSCDDLKRVIRKMVWLATVKGDVAAAKLVLDRCVGAVKQEVTIEEAGRRLVAEEIVDADTANVRVDDYRGGLVDQLYRDKK